MNVSMRYPRIMQESIRNGSDRRSMLISISNDAQVFFRIMMTSSNGNIFHVTGSLCGEFTVHRWFPHSKLWFLIFDLSLNKRLSKQSSGWWIETPSPALWRHCNVYLFCRFQVQYLCRKQNQTYFKNYHVQLAFVKNMINHWLRFDICFFKG